MGREFSKNPGRLKLINFLIGRDESDTFCAILSNAGCATPSYLICMIFTHFILNPRVCVII
jgi:hypothetical protein